MGRGMDYGEAYNALEELVETDRYQDFADEMPRTADLTPEVEVFGDRAIFYVQVADQFRGEYERKVIGEYRNGELGPVPFEKDFLERNLRNTGEVEIDETLLEPRNLHIPRQRKILDRKGK